MSNKLLYITSNHVTLEYDDLLLFSELNFDWFSTGFYYNPLSPVPPILRDPISPTKSNLNWQQQFTAENGNMPDFINNFDIIFVSNNPGVILQHWNLIKNKCIILRTYDNHNASSESLLVRLASQGVHIVRMFDWENNIPFSFKSKYVIGNYVDENTYKDWVGSEKIVLTFQNDFNSRLNHKDMWGNRVYLNYELYRDISKYIPCKLYGISNNHVSWEKQKELYRKSRVYFSLGTKPSSFTYNLMEAMMTGCPTLNFGKQLGSYHIENFKDSYKLPELIENGKNGFCFDDKDLFIKTGLMLLENYDLAKEISFNTRQFALKHFSKNIQKQKWSNFFSDILGKNNRLKILTN